jgi:hypothetical protein
MSLVFWQICSDFDLGLFQQNRPIANIEPQSAPRFPQLAASTLYAARGRQMPLSAKLSQGPAREPLAVSG